MITIPQLTAQALGSFLSRETEGPVPLLAFRFDEAAAFCRKADAGVYWE